MANVVYGLVKDVATASRLASDLQTSGFTNQDVSVLMAEKKGTESFAIDNHTKAPEGAAAGAGTGALLGGGLGWLAGIGALAIPGLGPLIAAGPIMAALTGAAVGGTLGGATGGLIGLGIPEYEAKVYGERVSQGNILISVHAGTDAQLDRAKQLFAAAGASDVHTATVA
ncbi:MAG: hypothetical protein QM811_03590 [Pirellulales bacterium]